MSVKKNDQDIDSEQALRQELKASRKSEDYISQAEPEGDDSQRPEKKRISIDGGVVFALDLREQSGDHNAPAEIAPPAVVITSDASDHGKQDEGANNSIGKEHQAQFELEAKNEIGGQTHLGGCKKPADDYYAVWVLIDP